MSTAATSKRNSSPSSLITTPSTTIKNGNDTAASRRTRRAVASVEVVKSDIQKSDKTGESSPSIQYNASPALSAGQSAAPSSATRKRKTNSLLGAILTSSPSAEKGAPLSSGTRNSARKSSALLSADIKLSPVLMDTKLLYEAGAIPIPNDQMDMDLDQPKETNGPEHNEEDQSQNDDNNTIETGNTPIRSKRRRGTRQNYAEPDDNDFSNKKQKTSLDMSNRNQIVIPSDNNSTGSSSVSPPHDSYIKSPSVPSSVSPPPHSPRDTSAQPNSRNQRIVSVIREYDVASDNDEENVADIIEENDDADVVEAKLYIQAAKVEAKELKSCVENVMKRYYDLKLRELNHEISLVEKGIHPEFIKESMNLDSMKAAELKKAENKLRHSVHSCEDTFEGCVKAANDTFTNNRRLLRNNLLSQKSKYKWQLKSEHESYNTFKTPSATYITPIKLANKKRLSLECAANTPSGLSESVGDIPSWTRRMIKKMRRGGRDAVLVPSACVGLSESEQADDKMFIDLLVEKKS